MGYEAWIDTVTVACCDKLWPFLRYRDSNSFDAYSNKHVTNFSPIRTSGYWDKDEKLFGVSKITKEVIEEYFRGYVHEKFWTENPEDVAKNFGWYSSFYFGSLGQSGATVPFRRYVNRLYTSVNRPITIEHLARITGINPDTIHSEFVKMADKNLSDEERSLAVRWICGILEDHPRWGSSVVDGVKSFEGFARHLHTEPKPKKDGPTKVYGIKYHYRCASGADCPNPVYVASARNKRRMRYSRDARYPYKTKASAKRMAARLKDFIDIDELGSVEVIEKVV